MAAGLQSVPSVPCVVWEFRRQDGGFSPFPPDVSAHIEAEHSYGSLLAIITPTVTLTFSKMAQRDASTGRERDVRRTLLMLPQAPLYTAYWTWNERKGSDVSYSIGATMDIESAYLRGGGTTSVNLATCPCLIPYTIDFVSMVQTRHGYNTQRKIQRCVLPSGMSLQLYLQQLPPQPSPPTFTPTLPPPAAAAVAAASFGNSVLVYPTPGGPLQTQTRTDIVKSKGLVNSAVVPPPPSSSSSSSYGVPGSAGLAGDPAGFTVGSSSPSTKSKRTRRKKSSKSPTTLSAADLTPYANKISSLKPGDDGPCPICMNQLSEKSGFEEEEEEERGETPLPLVALAPPLNVYQLSRCEHMMHQACLRMYMRSKDGSGFQCPTCKKRYGVKTGDMPPGEMNVRVRPGCLPGHNSCNTIEIAYNFRPGTNNGRRYKANGFPRVCYLPNSPKGQKVLKLLKVAWERKLTFTVGTSVTTGATDTVVWNEIHHKTESHSNHSGHGYPDPNYLDNILMELAAQGVEEEEEEEGEGQAGGLYGLASDSDSL